MRGLTFQGKGIAAGDLEQATLEEKGLPMSDLVLINDQTTGVCTRDGSMLPRNLTVLVRRAPLQNSKKPSVVLLGINDVWATMQSKAAAQKEERVVPVQRRPCPPAYPCPVCGSIFSDPDLAKCCGRSACSHCFKLQKDRCPLCNKPWLEETRAILNPQLAHTVESFNLDHFALPGKPTTKAPTDAGAQSASSGAQQPASPMAVPAAVADNVCL